MSAPALAGFAAALLNADAPVPAVCTTWNGSDVGQRFGVYRNNVVVSLIEAMRAKFPVVEALVGHEFFARMARGFVVDHPPQSTIMAEYGADFADFIAGFAPTQSLPYLADVARLEAARVRAYHAADAPVLSALELSSIAGDRLAEPVATLHPSVEILRSQFAIVSLWAAHQGVLDIASVDPFVAEDALILRPGDDVLVMALPPGAAEALRALSNGETIGDALLAATGENIDVPANFHFIITSGALSAARIP